MWTSPLTPRGVTLVERDNFVLTFYQDGSVRNVGVRTHVQGPGGIVLLEAGDAVVAADGSVSIRGRQMPGATFCSAFEP